ncbi:MAG: 3'-5' exonuclease [Ruminococcaceae bacterium]|nr:3'-5' exonuclease [Oscillospiraceae bacterium]
MLLSVKKQPRERSKQKEQKPLGRTGNRRHAQASLRTVPTVRRIELKQTMKLSSGASIPQLTPEQAESRNYLTQEILTKMHLMPKGDPAAYSVAGDGSTVYYFDPRRVVEAPPEIWYAPAVPAFTETRTLEDGTVIGRMSTKRAATCGYYTKERLSQMHYDVVEKPIAYTLRNDKSVIYFYDKASAIRQPLMCVECGKDIRYRRKLCQKCFEADLAVRREEGDRHRAEHYHMKRERVLFFDLELTGVYDHDEIISISILDGNGKLIMDTLVKPAHTKKWKKTEKIHGITPEMVADSPYLTDLIPEIKEIFANADVLIAYGISTDFSHIKYIYDTQKEREQLRKKTRCAANEYVRYIQEHHPELNHASLSDAMACLGVEWDGVAHTSIADTIGCAKVWEKLFPNYYEN